MTKTNRYWACRVQGATEDRDEYSDGCDGCKNIEECRVKRESLDGLIRKTAEQWGNRWK